MTSLLARLGNSFDTRRAAQTFLSTAGKRKRGEQWVCADCRARTTARVPQRQQRRSYSDDSVRLGAEGYHFPPQESEGESRDEAGWSIRGHFGRGEDVKGSNGNVAGRRGEDLDKPRTFEERENLWEQFEHVEEAEVEDEEARDTPISRDSVFADARDEVESIPYHPMLQVDYKAELSGALLRAETDLVIRCLFSAEQAQDLEFIQNIPATTFSEIIRLAEPRRFVASLGSAHIELSALMVQRFNVAPMRQVAWEYSNVLRRILAIRRTCGISLSLADYTLLLRGAMDLGNRKMCSVLWTSMLGDGHVPNTTCYNYMMATVVWNGVHAATFSHSLRIIPFNMFARKKRIPTRRFHGYRVGPGGVRETAHAVFNEMLANGALANEWSFRILMTASGREGDMHTVKSVLMKVWNIDVDGIMAGKDESTMLPKQRPAHSPLRPTADLLFTLAHIFGINNDIPGALRVVDFVARHYNLVIDQNTWSTLFEWTFVLAFRNVNHAAETGRDVGHLPRDSVFSLWNTMTSPPYNIKPTMGMYNRYIKHMFRYKMVDEMPKIMNEAKRLHEEHRRYTNELRERLREATAYQGDASHFQKIEKLRNEYEHANLIRQRNGYWLKRWVYQYLGTSSRNLMFDNHLDNQRRTLPRLLWDWQNFAPSLVRYETPTGLVELKFRSHQDKLNDAKFMHARDIAQQELLGAAPKYVGAEWTRGPTRKFLRLQRNEEHLEHDVDQ